ncbi:MSMEG_0569 family flavin-dependent oxidoreductase [Haliangium ochraceum]|uniref:FAD-dependent pyridine nucleotide-disulphide oxidoreductase n=1 Tax=Haliangium ochraceum (strain DSM 14365 / JCM 11303 / SMP-2) TaxID=502025 RepID=D0LSL4_HALO1|nr:MSMEG_0569 family flavin-dependent oxidoreductase [Haliangium ochraceum]ACY17236.1 FAD-dependent pyridine nucleotide-disulphide oxidoreductase [Haliangium ochraceum DSM 14365]
MVETVSVPVVVIGAGQAGLATSYLLKQARVEHVVLERHRPGHAWRSERWDSFCLVTPNWQCQLPGHPYAGSDPDGFMVKDEIAAYLEAYVASFDPPLRQGVEVQRVSRAADGYRVQTGDVAYLCDALVVATGGYHSPRVPACARLVPADVHQLHSGSYRNPAALPPGAVLVVGSGQSGCQIAEDLHLAGRQVHLAVGSAPRCARRYRGRDVVAWLDEMGHYRRPIDSFPDPDEVRRKTNHYVTGRDGGHDLDLRRFATEGMRLYGTLDDIDEHGLRFRPDLRSNLDAADDVYRRINASIDAYIAEHDIDAEPGSVYEPVWTPAEEDASLSWSDAAITSVIWCTGFGANYEWIDLPVFDDAGHPVHERGVTDAPGLFFVGLPWLHTWGSGRFCGVGDDARFIVSQVVRGRGCEPGASVTAAPAQRGSRI